MTRPDGLAGGVVADVRGRDVRDGEILDTLALRVEIDPSGAIVGGDVDELLGTRVRRGYGRQFAERLPDASSRSLRSSALEDLGGAFLVAGYAPLRGGAYSFDPAVTRTMAATQADVCAGWATGAPLLESLRDGVQLVPVGPSAPAIDDGWHAVEAPATGTVRRRRRLDVAGADGGFVAESHFRDSHTGDEGETVMHEYLVSARFDEQRRLAAVDVSPLVLPWQECPGAVASAQQLVGVGLGELVQRVRLDLVGPTTCTHLTSTMRSLADVAALLPRIA
jgi:hypothetical protein